MKRHLRADRIATQDTHGLSHSETLDRMDHTTNVSNAVVATTITISRYFVRVRALDSWQVVGFEFYGVFPYCKTRDVRIRLDWKILTDKFQRQGFAQLVNTFNPFDGYGGG